MEKTTLLDSQLPKIAKLLQMEVNNKVNEQAWIHSILHYHFTADGTNGMYKLRILLSDQTTKGIIPPDQALGIIENTMRKSVKQKSKERWYGIKLTVYPGGKHEIEYNFDPNCIDDPNFVDW